MLGDESAKKVVKLSISGAKVSLTVVLKAIELYLVNRQSEIYGKQSIKNLNEKGKKLENLEINSEHLKPLEKVLKGYGVDFSIVTGLENNGVELYFKSQDVEQINHALKKVVHEEYGIDRQPLKEKLERAVQKSKEFNQSMKAQTKTKKRNQERGKETI